MLGARGAARGALLSFLEQQPAQFVIANRDVGEARKLVDEFAQYGSFDVCGYGNLGSRSFTSRSMPPLQISVESCRQYRRRPFPLDASRTSWCTRRGSFLWSERERQVRDASRTASVCWSSKRPKLSNGGACSSNYRRAEEADRSVGVARAMQRHV